MRFWTLIKILILQLFWTNDLDNTLHKYIEWAQRRLSLQQSDRYFLLFLLNTLEKVNPKSGRYVKPSSYLWLWKFPIKLQVEALEGKKKKSKGRAITAWQFYIRSAVDHSKFVSRLCGRFGLCWPIAMKLAEDAIVSASVAYINCFDYFWWCCWRSCQPHVRLRSISQGMLR